MDLEREQWLEQRRTGLGSSDAAAVCGLSEFATPLHVYLDKLGLLPPRSEPRLRWGLKLEDVIAEAYTQQTGTALYRPATMMRHVNHPWMLATLDRLTSLAEMSRVVELKAATTSKGWGEPGTDEVPQGYLIQVQHQMAVAGLEVADVAVLIALGDFRVYTVRRSEALVEKLIGIERDFWRRVEDRDPPEPDWRHPETPGLVELLHRPAAGVRRCLGDGARFLAERYQATGEQIGLLKKEREEIKARLAEHMGDAEIGELPGDLEVVRNEVHVKERMTRAYSYTNLRVRRAKHGDTGNAGA